MRHPIRTAGVAVAVLGIVLALAAPANAAPGDPDGTFGIGGIVRTDFAGHFDLGQDALVQPNGRIVVVGQAGFGSNFEGADFGIARYRANGDPDTAFSGDGRQHVDFTGHGDTANAVTQDANGRIVVAGSSYVNLNSSRFAVARVKKGGAPDPTFSGDGRVRTAFPGSSGSNASDAIVQPDGKIVVVGTVFSGAPHLRGGGGQIDIAVVRYKPNGALDHSFGGGDGRVTTTFGTATDVANAVTLLDSGDILVAGMSQTPSGEQRLAVVEYRPNGTRDTAFSGDGKVLVNLSPGHAERAVGIAVRGDGKILIGASVDDAVSPASDSDIGVLLLKPNGSVATNFGGGDGKVFRDFGGTEDPAAMVRDPGTKKLVFVATRPYVSPASPQAIWVFRLKPNGAKDAGFGTGGRAELEAGDGVGGFGLALDASHRPVVTGRVGVGDDANFAVARFTA